VTIFVPAARVSRIKISPTTAAAARVRELKAAGHDIVDLTIGEPDFDTPDHVKVAAHAAIDRGETKYTAVNGTPALRAAIISDYKRRLGLDYAESEIVSAAAQADPFPGVDGKRRGGRGSHHSRAVLGVISGHGDRQ
jgi:aspartate aminotransferase